ncbi:MAG: hypothetical protein JKY30_08935 [Flavobacteriales bacterium]|nr:hypothetical protein [Flavobacteriales bacterium]
MTLCSKWHSEIIKASRSGITSGKLDPNSAKVFNKARASKIGTFAKGLGLVLTGINIFMTESDFEKGNITSQRRKLNHLNNGSTTFFPVAGIPLAIGDYFGGKHSKEIVNSVTKEGGLGHSFLQFTFGNIGLGTPGEGLQESVAFQMALLVF